MVQPLAEAAVDATNAAMAACEPETGSAGAGALLFAAAMLLPISPGALAEGAPDRATFSLKYLDYLDSQPGADRVRVQAPMLMLSLPFKEEWLLNASYVNDTVSGASPRYHTRSLTRLFDVRNAVTAALTRFMPDRSFTLATALSTERDYDSASLSATGSWYFDNKNTELSTGIGYTYDRINPTNKVVIDERKKIIDLVAGVTQVMTRDDIVQLTLRHSSGKGYYSDPYKAFDERPSARDSNSFLVRWNHDWSRASGISRLTYRYYNDTFGIDAHTLGVEYVQFLPQGWSVMPLVRLHSQNNASFYVPADPAQGDRPTFPSPDARYYTQDQRLSAFGAVTIGAKVSKRIGRDWLVDFKYEHYEQRSEWALQGDPDPSLAPFRARSIQVGFSYQF